MPTLVEKWIENGIEKGSRKTARESVVELLEIPFGNRPPQIFAWLNQLTDMPTLKLLHKHAAMAQSIGEFEQFLKDRIKNIGDYPSSELTR